MDDGVFRSPMPKYSSSTGEQRRAPLFLHAESLRRRPVRSFWGGNVGWPRPWGGARCTGRAFWATAAADERISEFSAGFTLKETCSTLRSQRPRVGKSLFFRGRADYTRRNCSVTELNVFDGADGCLPRDRAGGRGVGGARGGTAGIKKWSFSFIRLRSQRACWKKRATFFDILRSFATEFDATVSPVA